MDEVGLLVKALIRENAYDLLVENRKYLEFANTVLEGDHSTKALHALMACADSIHKCPENIDSILHFVQSNRLNIKEFGKSEAFDDQLRDILADKEESKVSSSILVNMVYYKAYNARVADIYSQAGRIASGSVDNPSTKERGPNAAQEYIAEAMQKVVVKTPNDVGGDLVENLDYMQEYINSFIIGNSKRVYTGFQKVDDITLIGPKQRNRWIGILGYTHHGKSLLLTTMLYNMAMRGANVMLVPRESSVEEAWMNIIWLHHNKVCPDRPIAKREDWMRVGAGVGTEKLKTIEMIIQDLREGNTLPGKIVVFPCNSWEDVEDKLHQTNKKYKFDVLAIDYFAHLEAKGGGKNESDIDKHKRSLRKAQMLTLNGIENDKEGLVIITPLQANKKGYEEAAKQEGDDYGIYKSPMAVEWFTQAAQDMDCIMSVWFEGDSCTEVDPKQMILHCMKGRMNMRFKTHRLKIHKDTGLLYDFDAATETVRVNDGSADNLSSKDLDDVMYTKTNVDADSWGI
jgi:hypothetical protein